MWQIVVTQTAANMLRAIKDTSICNQLIARIDKLVEEPLTQGKALMGELRGVRSVRAVGQRYRILYTVVDQTITVIVVAVGIRRDGDKKDIYALAKKLIKLGLVD